MKVEVPITTETTSVRSIDYSSEEVKRAKRRVDFLLLPFIILCFVMLQYDRTNLGNAQTDNFAKSLGMTQADINTGQTLFTLGMVLFELPSNIVAKKFGPNRWIPVIMTIWGLVTLCQAFIKGRPAFYATRFLLSAGEAGFIPGMAWYLTRFYVADELALRLAIFWGSNSIAGMTSGPLALGILQGMSGKNGWHGWRYLFLIEGCMTVLVAICAFLILPSTPMEGGKSLVGHIIMSPRQAAILSHRALQEDPDKAYAKGATVSFSDVKDTLLDWRLIGFCASAFLSSVIITPINTYGPSIVKALGYKGYIANGMQAPASAIGLVFSLSLAWSSDRRKERGLHISIAMFLSFIGTLWLALVPDSAGKRVLYGGYLMTAGTMGTGQAINASWLAKRFDERRRPVAMACYVGAIQLAGFAGANVFVAKDAPRYRTGLIVCGCCAMAAGLVVIAWKWLFVIDDRKRRAVETPDLVEAVEEKV